MRAIGDLCHSVVLPGDGWHRIQCNCTGVLGMQTGPLTDVQLACIKGPAPLLPHHVQAQVAPTFAVIGVPRLLEQDCYTVVKQLDPVCYQSRWTFSRSHTAWLGRQPQIDYMVTGNAQSRRSVSATGPRAMQEKSMEILVGVQ